MSWVTVRYIFPPSRPRPSDRTSTGPFTSARPSTASGRLSAETSLSEQVRAERAKLLALVIFIVCSMLPRIILVILSGIVVVIIVVVSSARRWTTSSCRRRAVSVCGLTLTVHDRPSRLRPWDEISFPHTFTYRIGPTVVDELNNGALSRRDL